MISLNCNAQGCVWGDQYPPKPPTPGAPGTPVADGTIPLAAAYDPNEIWGPFGYDEPNVVDSMRWISASQPLTYTINFENSPDFATAAAQLVQVRLPLDAKMSMASFSIGSFGWGDYIFDVPGSQSSHQTRIDLSETEGIYVDVIAGLDVVRKEAVWVFQTIDPSTGLPPSGVDDGFLKINDSLHRGEGFVSFTVRPAANPGQTGDSIVVSASIIFDENDPIQTNRWHNVLDIGAPSSHPTAFRQMDTLHFTFAGTDDLNGCGINQYGLYVATNGSSYHLHGWYTSTDTAHFTIQQGENYDFYSIAKDYVGNTEPPKRNSDISFSDTAIAITADVYPALAGSVSGTGLYAFGNTAALSATAATGYHLARWMVDGSIVSDDSVFSLVVNGATHLIAIFEKNLYPVSYTVSEGVQLSLSTDNQVSAYSGMELEYGSRLIVSATINNCYQLMSATGNGENIGLTDTLIVNAPLSIVINAGRTQSDTTFLDEDICYGTTYEFNGFTANQAGTYTRFDTNADGCDSISILTLTIRQPSFANMDYVACDSYTTHDGTTITTSTENVRDTLANTVGCDSVILLNLTVLQSSASNETATACDSYSWHGELFDTSGNYTYTTTNSVNCDSTITLQLTILSSTASSENATACDSYTWNDSTYTQTGVYTYETTNSVNCDSTATLLLTINHSTSSSENATACDSYVWNGSTYTQTGVYTYETTNSANCDSTATLLLTINHSTSSSENATACDSYVWNGSTYTQTGVYTYETTNSANCDSTATLLLTINHSTASSENATACDSYVWNGSTYTQTGVYTYETTNSANCDSTATLLLTVNYSANDEFSHTDTNTFTWNGTTYTESGDYTWVGQTTAGCDSTVTLHLTILTTQGIQDITIENITLYPNPTTGIVTISPAGVEQVDVLDMNGRMLLNFKTTNTIDLSSLPSGTYILRITIARGVSVKRIIKI